MTDGAGPGGFDILPARVAWRSPLVHHWRQTDGSVPP